MNVSVSDIIKALLQLVSCLGLAWLLYEQLQALKAQPETGSSGHSVSEVREAPTVATFNLERSTSGNVAEFNEITARPLFYSTRRPVGPTEALAKDATTLFSEDFEWDLTGIITGDNLAMAIFMRGNEETRTLKTGMKLDGWTVKAIDANGVTLEQNEETKRVALTRKESSNPPPRQLNSSTVMNKPQYRKVIKTM